MIAPPAPRRPAPGGGLAVLVVVTILAAVAAPHATALAWVTPVSGARCLALAAHVRALPDPALHNLLRGLPRERFDELVEAAYRPEGTAA